MSLAKENVHTGEENISSERAAAATSFSVCFSAWSAACPWRRMVLMSLRQLCEMRRGISIWSSTGRHLNIECSSSEGENNNFLFSNRHVQHLSARVNVSVSALARQDAFHQHTRAYLKAASTIFYFLGMETAWRDISLRTHQNSRPI